MGFNLYFELQFIGCEHLASSPLPVINYVQQYIYIYMI